MFTSKLNLLAATLLLAAPAAWGANPTSGEINDESTSLEWAGSGPYVFPNTSGTGGGDALCEPGVPQVCDVFALTVNISDEYRDLEENQRASVRIGISFPATTGTEDLDLYLYDAAGNLIGSGTGSFGVQETISVGLKTLKNGNYTVTMIPFTPMGANYAGFVEVGKKDKAAAAGFSLSPQVGSAPLTVTLDARALAGNQPAGAYVFDFGDGSAPVTDTDGVVEHTYLNNGEYLSRVRVGDTKGAVTAAQMVFVGDLAVANKSGSKPFGGALGWGVLLALAGLGAARLRRRA